MYGLFGGFGLRGVEHEFVDLAGVGRSEFVVVAEGLAFIFVEFAHEGVYIGIFDTERLECSRHAEHCCEVGFE